MSLKYKLVTQVDWMRSWKENLVRGNNIRKVRGIKENDPLGICSSWVWQEGKCKKVQSRWQKQDQEEPSAPWQEVWTSSSSPLESEDF